MSGEYSCNSLTGNYCHLGQIKKRIEKIGKASEVIMRMVSVPGISFLLATRLIGELQTFSRFATDSKLAMFVGLAPIAKDSGKVVGTSISPE